MNTQFVSNSQAEDRTNAVAGRRQLRRRGRVVVATVAAALMVASCSVFTSGDDNAQDGQSASQDAPTAPSFAVDSPTALSDADPSGAVAAQHFFPAEAGDNDPASEQLMVAGAEQADQYAAAQAAINAGAPMMIIPDDAEGEEARAKIKDLAPKEVIAWGLDLSDDPALTNTDIDFQVGGTQEDGSAEDAEATEGDAENAEAAPTSMAELAALEGPNDGQDGMPQVLVGPGTNVAQVATARAAGAPVQVLAAADPRATSESMAAIAEGNAVALGAGFGSQEEFDAQVKLAANGELPGGGGLVFPGRRMVALYGHPSGSALGVMGEQNPEEAVKLAQDYANQYQELTDYPVVPAFEIIATVASDAPGADGDYSNESEPEELRPYVDAITEAGGYAFLDLQPGRARLVDQAKIYEDLLKHPNVGLALDPEWKIGPDEVPMTNVGHVEAEEVNEVTEWLAQLVQDNELPQKGVILHQFQLQMLRDRDQIRTDHPELSFILHADGHGDAGQKLDTWNAMREGLSPDFFMAWKNFIDEDTPMFDPTQTYGVNPRPWFVSYQ